MKTFLALAVLGLVTLGAWGVSQFADLSAVDTSNLKTDTFTVQGMTCSGCAVGVKATVKRLPGVQKVEASFEEGKAVVTYDPSKVTPEKIKPAIEKLGYKAELQTKKPE